LHPDLSKEEKCSIYKNCLALNSSQLKELRALDIMSKDDLLDMYHANFVFIEKRLREVEEERLREEERKKRESEKGNSE